jgi:hypothetical protein
MEQNTSQTEKTTTMTQQKKTIDDAVRRQVYLELIDLSWKRQDFAGRLFMENRLRELDGA